MRDAGKHRSFNAGWPEAAMAGALGIALAGPRTYAGETVNDHWMGDGRARTTHKDIQRALYLYGVACLITAGIVGAIAAVRLSCSRPSALSRHSPFPPSSFPRMREPRTAVGLGPRLHGGDQCGESAAKAGKGVTTGKINAPASTTHPDPCAFPDVRPGRRGPHRRGRHSPSRRSARPEAAPEIHGGNRWRRKSRADIRP